MPDKITPNERELIDAALKRGKKVQKVPRGKSAYQMKWDEEKKGLRYVEAEVANSLRGTSGMMGRSRKTKRDPKVAMRRQRLSDLMRVGKTARQCASALGVEINVIYNDVRELGLKFQRSQSVNVQQRRAEIPAMIEKGLTRGEIADHFKVSVGTISNDADILGLTFPKARRRVYSGVDKAAAIKKDRAARKSQEVKDRRRFKTTPVPLGKAGRVKKHLTGAMYPNRVSDVSDGEAVLKDGRNNSKIGGDVLVGWLKGARIFTLSLEERATCPTSCVLWDSCYGNQMEKARRWRHGPELIERLRVEIAEHCAEHENVLIRLHVLGDFWSEEYLQFWAEMLDKHENLHVFGFTAWPNTSKIGLGVAWLRDQSPRRFMVRTSGMTGQWGSFTIDFPTDQKKIGDAVVCPEQLDAMSGGKRETHCGSCGVCWSSSVPIAFILH
ncbi:hypothetical protein [Roseovarius sp. MMSF_3281]|uniref:GP88 family protein n=1 Tax=Roseovarius sp. MMSF_3281 TaxID=3046694 RepID=UPI00273D929A|nr:hypothetical protein [Roseovarius sp. MMSF_3281]